MRLGFALKHIMDEIGDILKQARISKNMTIQDIYEITKIMPRYLKAIEDGQWDLLPGTVYAKGYIRSYAEAVGVDADYLVQQYERLMQELSSYDDEAKYSLIGKDKTDTTLLKESDVKPSGSAWWAAILVGVLVITFVFYFAFAWPSRNANNSSSVQPPANEQPTDSETTSPETTSPETTSPEQVQPSKPEEQTEQEQVEPQTELTLLEQKTNSSTYTITTEKERFSVTITATNGPCWIRITADGENAWEGTLKVGDIRTADAANEVSIRLGLPQNVDVKVEDQAIPHIDSKNPYNIVIQR